MVDYEYESDVRFLFQIAARRMMGQMRLKAKRVVRKWLTEIQLNGNGDLEGDAWTNEEQVVRRKD